MSGIDPRLDAAERAIGHTFADRGLLRSAITHPSHSEGSSDNWERLEFLGDAVLDLVVAEHLFRERPDLPEGDLTKLRAAVVSGATLSAVGADLGLAGIVVLGPSEIAEGDRGLRSALEACVEALVAAVYLDGGHDAASRFVHRHILPRVGADAPQIAEHPRSALQELLQSRGLAPVFRTVVEDGPPHDRTFTVEVSAGGETLGSGTGASKKEAGAKAAERALAHLAQGGWPQG